jgi:hypothetical protein
MSRGCGLGVQATNCHVDCSLARVDAALGAYQLQAQQLSPCVECICAVQCWFCCVQSGQTMHTLCVECLAWGVYVTPALSALGMEGHEGRMCNLIRHVRG